MTVASREHAIDRAAVGLSLSGRAQSFSWTASQCRWQDRMSVNDWSDDRATLKLKRAMHSRPAHANSSSHPASSSRRAVATRNGAQKAWSVTIFYSLQSQTLFTAPQRAIINWAGQDGMPIRYNVYIRGCYALTDELITLVGRWSLTVSYAMRLVPPDPTLPSTSSTTSTLAMPLAAGSSASVSRPNNGGITTGGAMEREREGNLAILSHLSPSCCLFLAVAG